MLVWVQTMSFDEWHLEISRLLFDEIQRDIWWWEISKRNKNIPEVAKYDEVWSLSERQQKEVWKVIQRYTKYLEKIHDPRDRMIVDIISKNKDEIDEEVLDNEVELIRSLTRERTNLLHRKENAEAMGEGLFEELDFEQMERLVNSVKIYSRELALDDIWIESSKVIDTATYTAAWVTWVLMLWHHAWDKVNELINSLYDTLSFQVWDKLMSWESVIAFWILAPFFVEMWHMVKQQWFKKYLKNNIWDSSMNVAWVAEVWVRLAEFLKMTNLDAGLASIFRIIRLWRWLAKLWGSSPTFQKNSRLLRKSAPAIASTIGTYWVISSFVTLILMELLWRYWGWFQHMWDALLHTLNLSMWDWYQDTFSEISESEGYKNLGQIVATIFMLSSAFIFAPIITAVASESMTSNRKNEQYQAKAQEDLADLKNMVAELSGNSWLNDIQIIELQEIQLDLEKAIKERNNDSLLMINGRLMWFIKLLWWLKVS